MFQYNLKSLLFVMLAVCVLTWLFFVLPGEIGIAVLLCLLAVVPSAIIAGILYFRGIPQAFAIGCVPPALIVALMLVFDGAPWRFNDSIQVKIVVLVCLLVILGGGGASAGIRWLAAWSRQPQIQTKTFPGLPLDMGPAAQPTSGPAGASPSRLAASRTLSPEP